MNSENKNLGIKELAKLAEVSIGTIDRVLHNREGVSSKTKARVQKIVEENGYKKNIMASRLKLASTKVIRIAILVPKSKNGFGYWNLPLQGVDTALDELSELGISAEYFYFDLLNPRTFRDGMKLIFEKEFDALITVPFFEIESNILVDRAKRKNMPVVFLDTERTLDIQSNHIRQNSFNAGKVAGRLLNGLIGKNGKYFVVNILNERGKQINNFQREEGYRAFFDEEYGQNKIDIHVINHPMEGELDLSTEIRNALIGDSPKGIFVTNSRSFLIPTLLAENNITDTHIVGFDLNKRNVAFLKSGEINFLINQKPKFQGYTAIKGLYKYLTEEDDSQLNCDIPVEIVVKENVDFYEGHFFQG
ncbi:MAG: LacI family transcriptional regulator [Saprospiraceae bacterium]|jgi:LacI family transcriptional regulator